MFSPSLDEVKEIAKNNEYKRIPVAYEMYSDIATPIEVLRILKKLVNIVICWKVLKIHKNGKIQFLGFDPLLEFTCQNGRVQIKGDSEFEDSSKLTDEDKIIIETDDPGEVIKDLVRQNKSPKLPDLPPFTGGFVGYFAYDYIKYAEPSLNLDAENQDQFKDIDLMLFDKVVAFDNFRQKIVLIANMKTDNLDKNYKKACDDLKKNSQIN